MRKKNYVQWIYSVFKFSHFNTISFLCNIFISCNVFNIVTCQVCQQHIKMCLDTHLILYLHDDVLPILATAAPVITTTPVVKWDDQTETLTSILDLLTSVMPQVKSCCCDDVTTTTTIGMIFTNNTQLFPAVHV